MSDSQKYAELYQSDDIIHGFGEVPAVVTPEGQGWMLPGREITFDRDEAEHHARRLDQLIQANMKRYDRSLIW